MQAKDSIWQAVTSYSKSQRIGIVLLFLIIVLVQGFYFFSDFTTRINTTAEKANWLAFQKEIDSLKQLTVTSKHAIQSFNPNFISDFKGYKLGMSVDEIDRLLAFRKQNRFVNSAKEFQQVTHVSDSLLLTMAPHFKFPDWANNKKQKSLPYCQMGFPKKQKVTVLDINMASKEDLMKIYGIGDKLSDRILQQREKLGGFVSMEQMKDIWGLSPEVIESLNKGFTIGSVSFVRKININMASIKELSQFPFFKYALAREIVAYRSMNGVIKMEDLSKIKGFPIDDIKIIALYLEL